jgi:methylated-DNA-protein-cysteine methyltransferase-like protein
VAKSAAKPAKRGKTTSDSYSRIYAAVRKIPRGRVTTYGAIARLAGLPGQPRLVGYALHAITSAAKLPWHRVINAQGKLSLVRDGKSSGITQHMLLEREGVRVAGGSKVSLKQYGWNVTPRGATDSAARRRKDD